ncbi:MAG: xanthine dehydrogenase family protein molybdopterin-binding subunit [Alphaproteobacteria bacterium]
MGQFGIGQAVPRTEDFRLLSGGGRYTDDVQIKGQAHCFVLRSPHAHAEIRGIDTAAAKRAPGVLAVLTGADAIADGLGALPVLPQVKNIDGSTNFKSTRPVLAHGKVRHVGDPVVAVIAETLAQARDAAELVVVDYKELPSVTDARRGCEAGAPLVWDECKSNLCFDWGKGDREATEAAFKKASRVVSLELVNNRVVVNPMETRAAVADYDAKSDRTTLYTSSQGVQMLKGHLNEVVKLKPEQVRLVTGDVGGGFGMKIFLHPEQPLVVWASRKLKRPVRWTAERAEGFLSDAQGRDHISRAEMALDDEGHFLGLRVTTWANLGAYLSVMAPYIPTEAGTAMLNGLYRLPAIWANVKGVMTNTVPVDAYRGAGRPEAIYLIERLVDKIARVMKIAPDELRRRNFIPPEVLPYTTALGDVFDSGEFTAIMEQAMKRADWAGFPARRAEAARRGKLRGIGLATYVERCGGGGAETADVRFDPAGERVSIIIGTMSNGQGHDTSYKQIMSAKLGIDTDNITVVQGDTDIVPGGLTGGSRSVTVGGPAVAFASEKIIAKGRAVAAHVMEAAEADIEYAGGTFTVAGTDRRMSLFDVAKAALDPKNLPEGATPGLDEKHAHQPDVPTFPNGAHICEIELDPDTGDVSLERYTAVDDFGDVINPLLIAGQVHGGVAQGAGQALWEHTVYDEAGQLVTGSFMDYTMPHADHLPYVDFTMRNVPCRTNPMGIKGAGEAGAIGAPPAVINAIVDAVEPVVGTVDIDMPATPDRVWNLLAARRMAAE